MKKVWIVIIIIIALIGGAIAYVLLSDSDEPSSFQQNTSSGASNGTDEQQPNNGSQPQPNAAAGQYVDYSAEAVANAEGRKWLFFHAPWCPQCRALEADIESQGVPAGLTIFKVDYDTSTELKQRYGVTLQTTVVEIDDEGNEVDKFVAYDDPSLEAVANALGD